MKALVNNHIIIKIICHIRVYNLLLGKLHLYDLSSYTWLLVSSFHKIVGFLSPIFVHCKKNNGFLIYFMIYLSIMQNADLCSCHHLHDKHCCCFYYHLFFFFQSCNFMLWILDVLYLINIVYLLFLFCFNYSSSTECPNCEHKSVRHFCWWNKVSYNSLLLVCHCFVSYVVLKQY